MHLLEVLNPVAPQRGVLNSLHASPRPQSLDNKTVGLLWSGTHGGDIALNTAGQMLKERFSNVKVNFYNGNNYPVIHEHARGSFGQMIEYMPLEGEARVSEHWKWLEKLTPQQRMEIQINVMDSPEDCSIIVVGADRAKTAVFPSGPSPVTEGVDQYRP